MQGLIEGYRRFRRERWPEQRALYETLALGQSPEYLVIACCDSRVDPSTIFRARPGELFVVRNVANLVPPFEQGEGLHGTSAAIEFAVRQLKVGTILVMGHARCGGVAAAVENRLTDESYFLSSWIELLRPAVDRCANCQGDRKAAVEQESIRVSLERLATFPFIEERLRSGALSLEGAIFDVADGSLRRLEGPAGEFVEIAES